MHRLLLLFALLAAPAHALEQAGIHPATYDAIMRCDVDIRKELTDGSGDPVGTLQGAIAAIEANLEGADRATRATLAGWLAVLQAGLRDLQATSRGKEKQVLDELQVKLAQSGMIAAASAAREREAARSE